MILEEDFDKNGEPWYNQQDLEHGKGFWSHPKLCVGWQILRAPERHQLQVKTNTWNVLIVSFLC